MVKTKVVLVKYLTSVDPLDIQESALPIKGVSRDDLIFLMDRGKLHIFVVVSGTIEEHVEEGNKDAADKDSSA